MKLRPLLLNQLPLTRRHVHAPAPAPAPRPSKTFLSELPSCHASRKRGRADCLQLHLRSRPQGLARTPLLQLWSHLSLLDSRPEISTFASVAWSPSSLPTCQERAQLRSSHVPKRPRYSHSHSVLQPRPDLGRGTGSESLARRSSSIVSDQRHPQKPTTCCQLVAKVMPPAREDRPLTKDHRRPWRGRAVSPTNASRRLRVPDCLRLVRLRQAVRAYASSTPDKAAVQRCSSISYLPRRGPGTHLPHIKSSPNLSAFTVSFCRQIIDAHAGTRRGHGAIEVGAGRRRS